MILGGAGGSTGTLEYTGGGTGSSNKTFTLATGGTGAFRVATGGTQLTLSGVIRRRGFVRAKTGTGTLILSGANSYTGTTTISEGTLSAVKIVSTGASSSIGNAATAVVLGGATTAGTLRYTGAAVTYTRGFTVNAGGGGITNAGTRPANHRHRRDRHCRQPHFCHQCERDHRGQRHLRQRRT